jgi:WD40-like Beta Propeller Repeat
VRFPRRGWIGALLLLAIGAFVALTAGRHSDLLSKATRLAVTRSVVTNEWTYSGYYNYYHHTASWFWLSDVEILSICQVTRDSYQSARINLTSGRVIQSAGRLLLEPAQDKRDKTFYWSVSPDGKWILYMMRSAGRKIMYAAKSFDGAAQHVWTNLFEGGTNPTWLSDSSGFVQWAVRDDGNYVKVHTLASGDAVELKMEPARFVPTGGATELKGPFALVPLNIQTSTNSAGEFVEVNRTAKGLFLKRFVVSVPSELKQGERNIFVSPRGKRLAWVVYFEQKIPRFSFKRAYPFVETLPRYSTAVLVSRMDGAQIRLVGTLNPDDAISALAWTPNGKLLGFIHDGSVWTVPAE